MDSQNLKSDIPTLSEQETEAVSGGGTQKSGTSHRSFGTNHAQRDLGGNSHGDRD